MERKVDDYLTRGYRIKQQGEYSTRMKEKDFGSGPVYGFTFLFSLIGSAFIFSAADLPSEGIWVIAIGAIIAYGIYSWMTAEEVIISVQEDTTN